MTGSSFLLSNEGGLGLLCCQREQCKHILVHSYAKHKANSSS